MSLSACKQVRHYITWWMTALGDTLVFSCTLVEIVQLTHTDKCYPSPVHWIAVCYMAFPKKLGQQNNSACCETLTDFPNTEEAAALTCCCLTCHPPVLIKACLSPHSARQISVLFLRYRLLSGWCIYNTSYQVSDKDFRSQKANVSHNTGLCPQSISRAVKPSIKKTITGIQ